MEKSGNWTFYFGDFVLVPWWDRKTVISSLEKRTAKKPKQRTAAADGIQQKKQTKREKLYKWCLGKQAFSSFAALNGRCLNDCDAERGEHRLRGWEARRGQTDDLKKKKKTSVWPIFLHERSSLGYVRQIAQFSLGKNRQFVSLHHQEKKDFPAWEEDAAFGSRLEFPETNDGNKWCSQGLGTTEPHEGHGEDVI